MEELKIVFVGDVFPGELPYTIDYGIRTQFIKHKGAEWGNKIKSIKDNADILIGNLESPLLSKNHIKKRTFYGEQDFAAFLKRAGFDIINIANNHILEHGTLGLDSTVKSLKSAGIDIIGQYDDTFSNIVCRTKNGIRIGVAGFSNADLSVINNQNNIQELNERNVLATLKKMSDDNIKIKILYFHWGDEYMHIPSTDQRRLAYKFIDNGANIIIGHHPHVIQAQEKYKDGLILYSLGNFLFDYIQSDSFGTGLIAHITISDNGKINFSGKGINLSYKKTIELMPVTKFDKYFSRINEFYNEYKKLDDYNYSINYTKDLKKNHLYQRARMKSAIFSEFMRINLRSKILLMRNISGYYIKKLMHI